MQAINSSVPCRRKATRNAVFQYLYSSASPRTKLEISRDLNMSMPTVYQNIDELLAAGLVEYCGFRHSSGGRPAMQLRIVQSARYAIGIHITPQNIHFSATDLSGSEIAYRRIAQPFVPFTDRSNSFIAEELETYIDGNRIPREHLLGVGISIPGVIDTGESTLTYAPTLGLRNVDLAPLRDAIPYPSHFENDATSGGFAEWFKSRERDSIAYLSLAEGVGGTILVNGALHPGNDNRSGEFGHMCIEWNGRSCHCGKRGCLEAYCSSMRIKEDLGMDADEFFFRVKDGDISVMQVWDDYKRRLVNAIHNIRIILDCDVVLGGFIAEYLGPYLDEIKEMLTEISPFDTKCDYLRIDNHPRFGNIIGAAFYFISDFIDSI